MPKYTVPPRIRAALPIAVLLAAATVQAQHSHPGCPDVKEGDFRKVSVIDKTNSNITEPIKFVFAKDGRIFWIERQGLVRRWHPATKVVTTLTRINVYLQNTRGGMGIILDPDFETNNWIYVVYTPNVAPYGAFHLSRFTVSGDAAQDEKVLLKVNWTPGAGQHASGSLAFDNAGNLFWGLGDATNPHNAGATIDGYAPIASNVAVNDARRTAGNTNDLNGKILRIKPEANGTYSIPAGNLFPPGTAQTRPEIYAMGFRNPWTLWYDKPTGWLFVGEVGPDANAANGQKGPAAMDELNVVKTPGNYGWPFIGGKNVAYNNFDYAAGQSGPLFNPNALVNNSPNNTGLKELPAARPSLLAYSHDGRSVDQTRHTVLGGSAGGTSVALPVYRYDPGLQSAIKLPPHFDNVWFFSDWVRNTFWAANLDAQADNVTDVKRPFPGISFVNVINGAIGPDGALYLIEYGPTFFASPSSQRISRIEYTGSCSPTSLAGSPGGRGAGHSPRGPRFQVRLGEGKVYYGGRDIQGRL